jgi:hypothetical protein
MKTILTIIIVALLISANAHAENILKNSKRLGGNNYSLLVFFDTAGLNNCNSNRELCQKNIAKYKELITKQSLRKMRVSSIVFYAFNEQVKFIGKIESKKAGKLFRESKKIMKDILLELEQDNSRKAKDSINLFHFINNTVEQSHSKNTKVGVLVFSNLRDSMSTKQERKSMARIKLNDKVVLHAYAASGLDASTMEKLNAEVSVIKYYTDKILSKSPIVIKTVY